MIQRRSGLTLLELLITITLIMIMVGFASFNYSRIVQEQQEGKARNECREFVKALKAWENKNGVPVREWVTEDGRTTVRCAMCTRMVETNRTCKGCGAALGVRRFELADLGRERIIKTLGDDPWSMPYSLDTTSGFVYSYGPNRVPGVPDHHEPSQRNIPGTGDDIVVPFRPAFQVLRVQHDVAQSTVVVEFSRPVDRSSITTVTVVAAAPVPITTLSIDIGDPYRIHAHLGVPMPKTRFTVTVPPQTRARDGSVLDPARPRTVSTDQTPVTTD